MKYDNDDSAEDKEHTAEKNKNEGNKHYGNKKYRWAIECYTNGSWIQFSAVAYSRYQGKLPQC